MSDPELDDERGKIEDLLRQMPLADPPAELDRRIDLLFHSQRRVAWFGPALGFAAGVLVTISIMLAIPSRPHRITPGGTGFSTMPPQVEPAQAGTTMKVKAEPRQFVDRMDAEINGTPVRLEWKRQEYVLWQDDGSAPGHASRVVIPDAVVVRPIIHY